MSMETTVTHERRRSPAPRIGLALLGVLLIGVNLRASFTAVGPVLDLIRADLHINAAAAGLLTSLPLLAFAAASPIAPAIARRLGLDRALWMALLLLTVGILIRSTPVLGAVWAGTALLGVAIAVINVLLPSLVKRDFPLRVAQVTGTYSAVQSAVAALAAGVVVPIAHATPAGWRLALGIWAGMALIAMAVLLPRLTRRPDDARARSRAAEPAPADPAPAGPSAQPRRPRSPWTTALAWHITLFMGLQSAAFFIYAAWLPSILHDNGVSAEAAGWYLFLFQFVAVAGNVGTAAVAHRFSDQRLLGLAGGVLCTVTYAGLLFAPSLALLWTVTAGLGCGSMIVLALSLFSLRTHNHGQAAALSGMAQSTGYLIAAAGPIAFGAVHDATGGWTAPLALTGCFMVVMSVFAVLSGRDRHLPQN